MKQKLVKYKPLWIAFKLSCTSSPTLSVFYIILTILLGLLPTVLVLCETKFIDTAIMLVNSKGAFNNILFPMLLIILILSFLWCSKSLKGILNVYIQANISNMVNPIIFHKQASLEYYQYEDTNVRDLIKRVSKLPEKKFIQTFENLLTLFATFITAMSTMFLMFVYIPLTSLIIVIASLFLFIVALKSGKENYEATKEALAFERKNDYLNSLLTGKESENERALFQYSDYLLNKWKDNMKKYNKIIFKTKIKWFINMKLGAIIVAIISMIVALLLLKPYVNGLLTLGFFIAIINAINKLVTKLSWQLTDVVDVLAENNEYMKDYQELMGLKSVEFEEGQLPYAIPKDLQIVFEHVSFTYPNSQSPVLNDVSFIIDGGLHYAIVGSNGAGKTTIIKLLISLYSNYSGNIYINGRELREYTKRQISSLFSVVFQDYAKYQISIRENITFEGEIEGANLEKLLKDNRDPAHLKEFINVLKCGVDTNLGKIHKDSNELSLGQWQKLAILRSLVRDASLYILDEPTSAMDPLSEREFFEQYDKMISGKTSISISHRLGSVRRADKIIVMDNGSVICIGTHEQLMSTCPIYSEMYMKQKGWYLT